MFKITIDTQWEYNVLQLAGPVEYSDCISAEE